MAQVQAAPINPFALMMNPESVLQAIESSARLDGLHRRVYRPLDKPLIPKKGGEAAVEDFDREVDLTDDE
ncbi:hypothetical protein [Ideonella sp. BN130291]|uniref:hypothetical protein n=1 Tax=Ideonella sp. BN130291 TaxID=3112940 RepID=UPI002E255F19|nr:hypothetical protein [Ideonella sp. BN130291]